jgi:hypothetical protein
MQHLHMFESGKGNTTIQTMRLPTLDAITTAGFLYDHILKGLVLIDDQEKEISLHATLQR